jgi:hypothetical protein
MFAHFILHVLGDATRPCSKVVERYEEILVFLVHTYVLYCDMQKGTDVMGVMVVIQLTYWVGILASVPPDLTGSFVFYPYYFQFNSWVTSSRPQLFPF